MKKTVHMIILVKIFCLCALYNYSGMFLVNLSFLIYCGLAILGLWQFGGRGKWGKGIYLPLAKANQSNF